MIRMLIADGTYLKYTDTHNLFIPTKTDTNKCLIAGAHTSITEVNLPDNHYISGTTYLVAKGDVKLILFKPNTNDAIQELSSLPIQLKMEQTKYD